MTAAEIALAIKKGDKQHKPVLIAIGGYGGSGKTTVANKLKEILGSAYIVGTDDFIIKERLTLVSPNMECYDLKRLENQVLAPTVQNKEIKYQILDWASNKLGEPVHVPNIDYLIIEGITAYFPSIAKYYDYKIWVDTPIEVAKLRGKQKDAGSENEQHWDLWSKNDVSYQQKYHPEQQADFVFNNTNDDKQS